MPETEYVCTGCGATDHDYHREKPPEALHCHSCKAGRSKSVSEMLASGEGMFPTTRLDPAVLEEIRRQRGKPRKERVHAAD